MFDLFQYILPGVIADSMEAPRSPDRRRFLCFSCKRVSRMLKCVSDLGILVYIYISIYIYILVYIIYIIIIYID